MPTSRICGATRWAHLSSRDFEAAVFGSPSLLAAVAVQVRGKLREVIKHQVGRMRAQTLEPKPIAHSASKNPRIAGRLDVHVGIPDYHRLARRGLQIAQQKIG